MTRQKTKPSAEKKVRDIRVTHHLLLITLCSWLFFGIVHADPVDDMEGLSEAEKFWLESDEPIQPSVAHVNEGQLNWLPFPADLTKYHLQNEIRITNSSLDTGWVHFKQCHHQLDSISEIELVYPDGSAKDLKVTHYSLMLDPKIQGNSVLMYKVKKGGKVCVSGLSKSVRNNEAGWVVNRGPYMRRFLDGYYPMYVSENIDWSDTKLKFTNSQPISLVGKSITKASRILKAKYHFEGILLTEYHFNIRNE